MGIERYTATQESDCKECGGTIRKLGKVFQFVLDDISDVEGPFCSESCLWKHMNRKDETEARAKLHMAAADLLEACEAALCELGAIDFRNPAVPVLEAAIARAKS